MASTFFKVSDFVLVGGCRNCASQLQEASDALIAVGLDQLITNVGLCVVANEGTDGRVLLRVESEAGILITSAVCCKRRTVLKYAIIIWGSKCHNFLVFRF